MDVVVEGANEVFGQVNLLAVLDRSAQNLIEAGGLDDTDLVVVLIGADGACGLHAFAEDIDDLLVAFVYLRPVEGKGVDGGLCRICLGVEDDAGEYDPGEEYDLFHSLAFLKRQR